MFVDIALVTIAVSHIYRLSGIVVVTLSFSMLLVSLAGVDHLPSLTCLQSGGGTGVALREVLKGGSRLNLHRFHRCTVAGTEADTYQEALNTLHELASSYDHME